MASGTRRSVWGLPCILRDEGLPRERPVRTPYPASRRAHEEAWSAVAGAEAPNDERTTPAMSAPFTPRQGQYLAYLHTYTQRHGQPPSEAELAAYFDVSPPSAHQMVDTLARRGLIARTLGQARSIRVLVPPEALPDLASGPPARPAVPSVATTYPHLARWIMGEGWVELGRTAYTQSLARALDEGGVVWEGKDHYGSVDELLRDLNAGITAWLTENT
jgi:hypothetical protein